MKNETEVTQPMVVSLDLGTTKTVIMFAKRTEFGKIETIAFGKSKSMGISGAEVVNILDASNSIKQALQNCYESNKEEFRGLNSGIKEVIVGIAGKHITSKLEHTKNDRENYENEITFEEIEAIRMQQFRSHVAHGDEIFNVIPQHYVLDGKHTVTDPVGCLCRRIDAYFHIISGNKDEIMKIGKAVEKAGLVVDALYLQPLASAMAILTEDLKNSGVVIADIGGGTTDIAIFQNGSLKHTSVINLAGNFITEDIYNSLKLFKRDEAEALKVQFGSCVPDLTAKDVNIKITSERDEEPMHIGVRELAFNINNSVKEIISHINNSLHNSGVKMDDIRGGIHLTGGSALLKNLNQLVAHEISIRTKIGLPNHHLAPGYQKGLDTPDLSTSYGLILYGFELYDHKMKELLSKETAKLDDDSELKIFDKRDEEQQNEVQLNVKTDEIITNKTIQSLEHTPKIHKKSINNYFDNFFKTINNEFGSKDEKF